MRTEPATVEVVWGYSGVLRVALGLDSGGTVPAFAFTHEALRWKLRMGMRVMATEQSGGALWRVVSVISEGSTHDNA